MAPQRRQTEKLEPDGSSRSADRRDVLQTLLPERRTILCGLPSRMGSPSRPIGFYAQAELSSVIFARSRVKKLSEKTIENTLVNIGVRGVTEKVRRSDPPQVASNFGERNSISQERRAAAIAIARGGPGTSGNANFPFEFAVPYHETVAVTLRR